MLQKLFQKIANEAKFPTNFMRSGQHCYNPEKGSMRKGNQRTLSLSNNISAKQIQQGIKSKTTHMYTHHHIISHHVTCQIVKYSKYLTTSGYGHLPIRRDVGLTWILHGGILMLISSRRWGLVQDGHGWCFCGFGWSG